MDDNPLHILMYQFLNNSAFQGAIISIVASQLHKLFKGLDGATIDPKQSGAVQAIVSLLSVICSLLVAYTQHRLSGIDPQSLITSIQVAFTSLLGVFGAHQIGTNAKATVEAVKANPKLGPVGKFPFQK